MEDHYLHKGRRKKLCRKLREKGIEDDNVLEALQSIPRHWFLDSAFLEHAYQDKPFPIGCEQTISQPYTVARQTELLQVAPGMKVLEVGTGSGYQAAVLCQMGAEVHTIEVHKALYEKARHMLQTLDCHPHCYLGDGSMGLPQQAPFHRILVTAAAEKIPQALKNQLAEGGKLVVPAGKASSQTMWRITRRGNEFVQENFGYFRFVPLVGAYQSSS